MQKKMKEIGYFIVLFLSPLIVFGKRIKLHENSIRYQTGIVISGEQWDFFNYYKELGIGIGALLLLLAYLSDIKKLKNQDKYSMLIKILIILNVLSFSFSPFKEISLLGIVERFEGVVAEVSYLVIFLCSLFFLKSEKMRERVLELIIFSSTIIFTIGIFQYFNISIYENDFVMKFITGFKPENFQGIDFTLRKSFVYGTHSNPNYMGSYAVIMFFLGLGRYLTEKRNLIYGCYTLLAYANLVGSHSRAGQAGYYGGLIILFIFLGRDIRKYWKKLGVIFLLVYGVWYGMDSWSEGFLGKRMEFDSGEIAQIYAIKPIEDGVIIEGRKDLTIKKVASTLEFYDESGGKIEVLRKYGGAFLDKEGYRDYRIQRSGGNKDLYLLSNGSFSYELLHSKGEFYTRDHMGGYVPIREIARFKLLDGYEKKGSNRGYIWSRSIPLLWTRPLFGWGQDNFVLAFPQDDFLGKSLFYGNRGMLVDKPHNYFLQIGINNGIPYLLITLILFGVYFIKGMIIGIRKKFEGVSCIFIASTGYMITLLFNDSVVSVAPIFWCLLSMGVVLINERRSEVL